MTPAPPALPRLDDGPLTPAELVEIERTWRRFRVVKRLIQHIRVLHYELEALRAETRTPEPMHVSD